MTLSRQSSEPEFAQHRQAAQATTGGLRGLTIGAIGFALLSLTPISSPALAAPGVVELDVIVKDGDAAPGTTGTFDLMFNGAAVAIDDSATVFFFGASTEVDQFSQQREGLWSGTGAFVDEVAIDGQVLSLFQPPPEDCVGFGAGCGELFNTQSGFYVTGLGLALLRTSRSDNRGPIAYLAGPNSPNVEPILVSTQIPQFPFRSLVALQTESGEYLAGPYIGTEPFGEANGGLTDFVTPFIGGAAPFTTDPVTITDIFGTVGSSAGVTFGFNQNADRLFVAALSDDSEALYFDPAASGPSSLLARSGQPTPGIGIGQYTALTSTITIGRGATAQINDAGQGYFSARWRNPSAPLNNSNLPRQALWRFASGSAVTLVVSEYLNPATDPGFATSEFGNTAFDNISGPKIAAGGEIYFHAIGRRIDQNGIPDSSDERVGLWRAPTGGGPLELVLRITTSDAPGSSLPEGPNVPGTELPGGGNFVGFGSSSYGLDEHGHLLFGTQNAIYAEDDAGLRLVVKNGETLQLATGDLRTVSQARVDMAGLISDVTQSYRGDRLALRVRFDDGSNAVMRTRFLPPPPPPKLVGLEVIQVVQDWNNSIPLIENKQTLLRAHIESPEPVRLNGRLTGQRDGSDLSVMPLQPSNPGGYIFAPPDPLNRRGFYSEALHFELPADWTTGQVTLKIALDGETLDCAEAAGPVRDDCRVTVQFDPTPALPMKLVSFAYEQSPGFFAGVNRLRRQKMICQLVSSMPVSANHTCAIDWTDAEARWPEESSNPPNIRDMLTYIKTYRRVDGCRDEDGCKRLYQALTPVDRVSGLATVDGTGSAVYVRPSPRSVGSTSHIHELVHSLGRRHSVHSALPRTSAGRLTSPCGATAPPSVADFPYFFMIDGRPRVTLGPMESGSDALVYGADIRKIRIADPFKVFDLMDYCRTAPMMRWPAKTTYETVLNSITSRFAATAKAQLNKGPSSDYLVVTGTIDLPSGRVTFSPSWVLPGINPPTAIAGDYQARFLNATGGEIAVIAFDPDIIEPDGEFPPFGLFQLEVPANPLIRTVEISDAGGVIGLLQATALPPAVSIVAPSAGAIETADTVTVSWTADDDDSGELFHSIHYSADDGLSWSALATNWRQTQYEAPRLNLAASDSARIRITTSDGFNSATAISEQFSVGNNNPTISIERPENGMLFTGNQMISLAAASIDTEDGPNAATIEWSSSQDGVLGTSHLLELGTQTLSVGSHNITAVATDSDAGQGTDSISITITDSAPTTLSDFEVETVPVDLEIIPGDPAVYTVTVKNAGPQQSVAAGLTLSFVDAANPSAASFQSFVAPAGVVCAQTSSTTSCDLPAMQRIDELSIQVTIQNTGTGALTLTADLDPQTNIDPRLANNIAEGVVLTSLIRDDIFADGFENL